MGRSEEEKEINFGLGIAECGFRIQEFKPRTPLNV
jgi:hypothetical protein